MRNQIEFNGIPPIASSSASPQMPSKFILKSTSLFTQFLCRQKPSIHSSNHHLLRLHNSRVGRGGGVEEREKKGRSIRSSISGFFNLRLFTLRNGLRRRKSSHNANRLRIFALTEGSANKKSKEVEGEEEGDPSVPSWAKPGSDEPPPWASNDSPKDSSSFELPFFVYLLASAITAIAAIGSIFEYVNQKPVFGVLNSDSVFYTPLLGFFAITGIPSSAFLWFKSVEIANKEAEEQDRRDGYL